MFDIKRQKTLGTKARDAKGRKRSGIKRSETDGSRILTVHATRKGFRICKGSDR